MNVHRPRAAVLLAALAPLAALAGPAVARADTVTDWNAIAASSIVVTGGQSPQAAALSLAMVQGAVYDAVNAIDRSHRPYLVLPAANPWDSTDAAAAAAAYRVLVGLFPGQESTLHALYVTSLAAVPDGPIEDGGVAAGEAAAAAMLAARTNDGRNASFTFVFGSEPGQWRLAPPQGPALLVSRDPAPWVGGVRPFLVPDIVPYRSDPPNALDSNAYAEDFNEVKEVGALTSTTRTADQTAAAIFWQDHGPVVWNRVMRALAASHGLDAAAGARLFASTNLAAADASIGCWESKYHWSFWRPITAIREAGADGHPATEPDPGWTPLFDPTVPVSGAPLNTPGFPDHPAGHGCISGAYVHTLQDFFGTDKVAFTAVSSKCLPAPCPSRSFDRLSLALKEIIDARVWSGIHFRTADVQGAVLGKKLAHYLQKRYFQPVG